MDEAAVEATVEATKALKQRQETPDPPEALECIPSLQVCDCLWLCVVCCEGVCVHMCVYLYVCMCVCVCVCIYLCMYVHIYTYMCGVVGCIHILSLSLSIYIYPAPPPLACNHVYIPHTTTYTPPQQQLSDIPKNIITVPTAISTENGATLLAHDLFTNDVLYLEATLDMRGVPSSLLPLMPLFCRALTQMGTEKESFVELTERIGRKTGGVSASAFVSNVKGKDEPVAFVILRGKAMGDKAGDMLSIMTDVLHTANLDNQERFKQVCFVLVVVWGGMVCGCCCCVCDWEIDHTSVLVQSIYTTHTFQCTCISFAPHTQTPNQTNTHTPTHTHTHRWCWRQRPLLRVG